jgi:hypothetical protein
VAYYVKDYYVHNSDEGYAETGSGWAASSLKSYSNQGARESTVATDSASWTPNILAAGNYAVYTWNVVDASSDPAAKYGVTDSARNHQLSGGRHQHRVGRLGEPGHPPLRTRHLGQGGAEVLGLAVPAARYREVRAPVIQTRHRWW